MIAYALSALLGTVIIPAALVALCIGAGRLFDRIATGHRRGLDRVRRSR